MAASFIFAKFLAGSFSDFFFISSSAEEYLSSSWGECPYLPSSWAVQILCKGPMAPIMYVKGIRKDVINNQPPQSSLT